MVVVGTSVMYGMVTSVVVVVVVVADVDVCIDVVVC